MSAYRVTIGTFFFIFASPSLQALTEDSQPALNQPVQASSSGIAEVDKEHQQVEEEFHSGLQDPLLSSPWSLHAQATFIDQYHWKMHSPYAGTNSLTAEEQSKHTITSTIFLGRSLWRGGEVYVNPEMASGAGFSAAQTSDISTVGMAGFPNGDATRAATIRPHFYWARYFFRQTIGLGGDSVDMRDDKNQVRTSVDAKRLVFTLGKLSANDIFDANSYSHDARTQFLNWSLWENSAWDYPADARGYTHGAAAEFYTPGWAFRIGTFMEPKSANLLELDDDVVRAHGDIAEVEKDYSIGDHPGAVRVMGYINHGRFGNYRKAIENSPTVDVASTDRYGAQKFGFGLNCEQEIGKEIGVFARAGWNDGHAETWAFTEVDRTVQAGMVLKGTAWYRPHDVFGLAGVVNGLSNAHKDYLAAGGVGFIVGDGALSYGPESIIETYYLLQAMNQLQLTADYQYVKNPGYNRDRGPVSIGSIRVHVDL